MEFISLVMLHVIKGCGAPSDRQAKCVSVSLSHDKESKQVVFVIHLFSIAKFHQTES